MEERTYAGQCHCGALRYRYTTAISPARWSVRACQCRFCRAHGALSTSDPHGTLAFTVTDPAGLQRYRFDLRTADFLVCRECGVYVGAAIETPNGRFGILNTRSLTPPPAGLAAAVPADYGSEVSAGRIARREARWTPITAVPLG